jgi:hypothetical protein
LGNPHWSFFLNQGKPGTMNHVYWCLLCKDNQIMVILSKFGYQTATTLPTLPALQDLWQTMCLCFFFSRSPQLAGWSGSFFCNILHYITLISVTSNPI